MNGAKRIEYAQTKPNMTIYDQTHTLLYNRGRNEDERKGKEEDKMQIRI